jgi:hypothetical protein
MTAKLDRERWWREPPTDIAKDDLANLVFAQILDREAELIVLAEAEADVGPDPELLSKGVEGPGEEEIKLAVVRALLRLILSPNVRMPLSRLQ